MMTSLRHRFAITVLVVLAGFLGSQAGATSASANGAPHAEAPRSLPFRGTLEGVHVSRVPVAPPVVFDRFETDGQATLLGQFTSVIEATVDFGSRPVTGVGTYTFIAANGDRLVAAHTGSSSLVQPGTVLITEVAVIDPERSTGRFAGARGTFTVKRLADAATGVGGRTSGEFEGTVSLATGG
jgi:hypothetical protein